MKKITAKEFERVNMYRRLFDRSARMDVINISAGNTLEHELTKCYLAIELAKAGRHFLTEAPFKNGNKSGRCDIVDLSYGRCIEVTDSETEDSIEKKRGFYPLRLLVIKAREMIKKEG